MTTGWHYFVDVLGGLVVAEVSILAAKAYLLGWRGTATRNLSLETARSIELKDCRTDGTARQIRRQA